MIMVLIIQIHLKFVIMIQETDGIKLEHIYKKKVIV